MKKLVLKVILTIIAVAFSIWFVKAIWNSNLPDWLKIYLISH